MNEMAIAATKAMKIFHEFRVALRKAMRRDREWFFKQGKHVGRAKKSGIGRARK